MKTYLALSIAVFLVIFNSCKKDDPQGTGTLNVRMTDAPAVYDSVNIEITGVEVHSDLSGWTAMSLPAPGIYNLLDFNNGLDTLIATTTLPEGNVSQIRLILGNNNSVTIAGQTFHMDVPSGATSGLKINVHSVIVQGVTTVILIDFDAARSVVDQGNGEYHLKPVIRAVATGIDGSIKGVVVPAVSGTAYAIAGTDSFGTTIDPSGSFLISGVPAGSYDVFIHPASPYADKTINNVSVTANTVTDIGTINL
jgi:hypothetical protein